MMRRTIRIFLELVIIIFLGLLLALLMTGGFVFSPGLFTIKVHSLKNPLIVLMVALILKGLLDGTIGNFQVWRAIQWLTAFSQRVIEQAVSPSRLRMPALISLCSFIAMTGGSMMIDPQERGLRAAYYQNTGWRGAPILSATDSTFSPKKITQRMPDIKENYSIEWTGVIFIPAAAEYRFTLGSDDGSELYLDEQRVVDNSGVHGYREKSGTIRVEQGIHAIRVRYFQGGGDAIFKAYWAKGNRISSALSSALLFPQQPTSQFRFLLSRIKHRIDAILVFLWSGLLMFVGLGTLPGLFVKMRRHCGEIQALTALSVMFLLSRVYYYFRGIRFDASPLQYFWQFLDPIMLKNNLWESLYYLHVQPPLFNLFAGLWLKIFSKYADYGFWMAFAALSLIASVAMYRLFIRFGCSPLTSLMLVSFYMVSPTAIVYENWLFYTWPVAMLVLISTLSLWAYLDSGKLRQVFMFFMLICAVALIRSAFHLLWVLAIVLGLLIARPLLWKRTLLAACVPLIVLFGVYVKNTILFSSFSASSWMWINFSKMTVYILPESEKARLIDEGLLSPASKTKAFAHPEAYAEYIESPPPTGREVLDRQQKSNGAPNMNHLIYLTVSQLRKQDNLYIMTHYPGMYARSVLEALMIFTRSATDHPGVRLNAPKTGFLEKVYNLLLYGQFPGLAPNIRINPIEVNDSYILYGKDIGVFVVVGIVFVAVSGLICVYRILSDRVHLSPDKVVMLYMWMTIMYVTLAGNLLEMGENNRFRVMIEPLLFVSIVVQLLRLVNWNRSRRIQCGE